MHLMSRLLSGLFVLTALLLTFTGLSADWLFELCTITDQNGNRVSLIDLQRKSQQISHELQISIENLRSKETVAESLYRGKITLVDAAAMFRSLYEDRKSWHHPHRSRPGRDDGESWCREVIDWTETKVRIEQSPSQAGVVRQRLEAELQKQRVYHGEVKLPD